METWETSINLCMRNFRCVCNLIDICLHLILMQCETQGVYPTAVLILVSQQKSLEGMVIESERSQHGTVNAGPVSSMGFWRGRSGRTLM